MLEFVEICKNVLVFKKKKKLFFSLWIAFRVVCVRTVFELSVRSVLVSKVWNPNFDHVIVRQTERERERERVAWTCRNSSIDFLNQLKLCKQNVIRLCDSPLMILSYDFNFSS